MGQAALEAARRPALVRGARPCTSKSQPALGKWPGGSEPGLFWRENMTHAAPQAMGEIKDALGLDGRGKSMRGTP